MNRFDRGRWSLQGLLQSLACALLLAGSCLAAAPVAPTFVKHIIDLDLPAISAVALDVDGDGILDVVAGGGPAGGPSKWSNLTYWYQGPAWQKKPVGVLSSNAIILNVERVIYSRKMNEIIGPADMPPEVTVDDGGLGDIWWYRYNRATGQWSGRIIVTPFIGAHGTSPGDIDGDGYSDILVPTQMGIPKEGMLWARNPGPSVTNLWATYPLADKFSISGWQEGVRLADLNGDGKLDAMHASDGNDGWFGFWLQGSDPFKAWTEHRLNGPMKHGTCVEAADMNGDGRMDIVGSEGHGVGIWWFPAPDYPALRVDDTLKSVHSLALGDFNKDGTVDVAGCGYDSKIVACFLNDGKGSFTLCVLDTNQCAYNARAVDLDGDGDLDILLSGQNSGNLVWYENRGSPAAPGK